MRRDRKRQRENGEIFDDVLPLERRDEKALPCHRGKKHEREERHEEMRDEERDHKPFHFRDEKEDANEHLVQPKKEDEILERHKWKRSRKKTSHHRIRRTRTTEFERAEPEVDDEKRKPRERHVYSAKRGNEGAICIADEWQHLRFLR